VVKRGAAEENKGAEMVGGLDSFDPFARRAFELISLTEATVDRNHFAPVTFVVPTDVVLPSMPMRCPLSFQDGIHVDHSKSVCFGMLQCTNSVSWRQ
jgi:hypothetical protein